MAVDSPTDEPPADLADLEAPPLAAALNPVARKAYDWYLNSPLPATFGSAVSPTSSIGRIPGSFLLALFGAGLDSMIATQEVAYRACLAAGEFDCRIDFDPANVVTPTLIVALAGLGLLALVPVLARRLLMRRAAIERP